jgi:predicted  nucleic acid-binding Zn-ribbon protein
MNRRDLFKFLAGIGLGAVAIETYERLYHIPMLETMFRKELEYWINQYNTAREEVERLTGKLRKREDEISSLRSELAKSKEELEHLIQQYNTTKEEINRLSEKLKQSEEEINNLKEKASYWEARYNTTREEIGRLNSIINKIDELERESTSAIAYYRGRMDEAIRKLREVIERYRVLLGDERVSFEYSTLKILEDLRLAEERLQRVLPYFPLILNLYWKPVKVINDKIYDVNVVFEVISPLSSLEVVEVTLRPVEYKYFITMYGMREEDYSKVFPEEDVRIVRIKPLQIERIVFSVDFKDLKGGREYFIEVRVRDVAGNERIVEVKTPYIRQFENIAKTNDITVAALYLLWWGKDNNWAGYKGNTFPLLGKYSSKDTIVINKHVDWATGHGINVFIINWDGPYGYQDDALKSYFLEADLVKRGDIEFGILYETHWRLKDSHPGWDLSDPENVNILRNDLLYLKKNYFNRPSCFKINNKPFLFIWESKGFFGDLSIITNLRREYNVYMVSDHAHPEAHPTDIFRDVIWGDAAKRFDAIMNRWGWERYPESDMERWLAFAIENNLNFIAGASVGLSYRYAPWSFPGVPEIPRDPDLFKKEC